MASIDTGGPTFAEYRTVRIGAIERIAEDQVKVAVAAPASLVGAHERPGQFVRARVRAGDEPGIFAMMSAPFERAIVLLLRTGNPDGGETADAIARSEIGTELEMSPPAGEGFALERALGRPVFVVATGTAIAPARAAIETMLKDRKKYGPITLDHGLRSPAHLAIGPELARWKRAGVATHLHHSQPSADGRTVEGVLAHDALLSRLDDTTLRAATFLAVGQPTMVEELRTRVILRGGHPEHVLSNH